MAQAPSTRCSSRPLPHPFPCRTCRTGSKRALLFPPDDAANLYYGAANMRRHQFSLPAGFANETVHEQARSPDDPSNPLHPTRPYAYASASV